MKKRIRLTIWNEHRHEQLDEQVQHIYPDGMHQAIAQGMPDDFDIRFALLDEPSNGLPQDRLDETDVLIWWGHRAHGDVADDTVERVYKRVLEGMGLVVLHSGHFSKIFKKLMGTTCDLKWRVAGPQGERERLWVVNPSHPIAEGIGEYIELDQEEMYGEHFDIPDPDQLVFASWFEGGELFRSGCCWHRGHGKIFYFRPGHETFATFFNSDVRRVIANGVRWAAPVRRDRSSYGNKQPLEKINRYT